MTIEVPLKKPSPETYDPGPWSMTVLMMSGITLWIASMQASEAGLPPEAYRFNLVWSRLNLLAIAVLIGHRMYRAYAFKLEVERWNAQQVRARADKPVNPGETSHSKDMPFSYWDIASRAHPSAFLTSALVRPRIFPFPMGFSAEKKNLYWESGQQPEVGHFKPGSEYEKKKREEKIKEITTRLRAEDRATQERAEIYTEQKRMAEQRIKHVKILCSIVLLAFVSRRVAILALVPFMYSVFVDEMERLLTGRKSKARANKRARPLKTGKDESKDQPGMGMSYLYRPVGGGLDPLTQAPIIEDAPVLMTSQNPRLAGNGFTPKTQPPWIRYEGSSTSSKSAAGGLAGGVSSGLSDASLAAIAGMGM